MTASGTPCESSSTVSRSGHLVALIRRRRSSRSASGKPTCNSRMAVLSAMSCDMRRLLGCGDGLHDHVRAVHLGGGRAFCVASPVAPVNALVCSCQSTDARRSFILVRGNYVHRGCGVRTEIARESPMAPE